MLEHDEPPMDGAMTEGYGQRFGERLRVENAPAMVTRALRNADIAGSLESDLPSGTPNKWA